MLRIQPNISLRTCFQSKMLLQVATQSVYTVNMVYFLWSTLLSADIPRVLYSSIFRCPAISWHANKILTTKYKLIKVLFFAVDVFWSNKRTPRILRQASNKQLKYFPPFDNPQVSFIFSVPKGKVSHFHRKCIFRLLAEISKNLISLRSF